jgi:hypothetical protein
LSAAHAGDLFAVFAEARTGFAGDDLGVQDFKIGGRRHRTDFSSLREKSEETTKESAYRGRQVVFCFYLIDL